MENRNAPETILVLDWDIPLSQELNQSVDTAPICDRAEAGLLSAGRAEQADLTPEEALALAIAQQALADYETAAMTLRRKPGHEAALALLREVESFLRSAWFHLLMDLDGEQLISTLRRRYALEQRSTMETSELIRLRERITKQKRRRRKNAK